MNFMLWVYFYNYQRSLFWCWVFFLASVLRRVLCLGFFCLFVVEAWRGYFKIFGLELSLCGLLGQAYRRASLDATFYVGRMLSWGVWSGAVCSFLRSVLHVSIRVRNDASVILSQRMVAFHGEAIFCVNAFTATYADSGIWDTFLLISFDRAFRSVMIFSILPLSENNLVEKMSTKLSREFVQAEACSSVKKNLSLGAILRSIACCLALLFIFMAYVTLLAL